MASPGKYAGATLARGTTRSGRAYDRLRQDILDGRLTPGQRLPFAELVQEYQCSIGSLREALQRLASLGLVESEVQQGFRVVSVSVDDLIDLTVARAEIEVLALKYACRDGDMSWEATVVAAHHVLERTPQFADESREAFTEDWAIAHGAFHQALLNGCSNRRLLAAATSLRDSAELYRRWSIPFGHDVDRDIAGEHKAILDAAIGRDAEAAGQLLACHIERTTENLLAALPSEPAEN